MRTPTIHPTDAEDIGVAISLLWVSPRSFGSCVYSPYFQFVQLVPALGLILWKVQFTPYRNVAIKMLVEKSSPELEGSFPAPQDLHPIFRRTEVGRNREGFIAEQEFDDESPNYFGRHQVDVKNITTLENLPDPDLALAHPPTYEESETSAGIDENGTPHQVTIRSLSVSEALPVPKHPHVWQIKRTTITLSALEATVLVKAGILEYKDLRL